MSKLGLVVLDNNNKNKIQIDTHPSVKSNEQVRLGRFRQQQKNKIQIDTHLSVKSNKQVRLGHFRQQKKNKN